MSGDARTQGVRSLDQALAALDAGDRPVCTVRQLLEWFGARRRDPHTLAEIDKELTRQGLRVDPPLSEAYIDEPVAFLRIASVTAAAATPPKAPVSETAASVIKPAVTVTAKIAQLVTPEASQAASGNLAAADYERKVRHIPSATLKLRERTVQTVSPNDDIRTAVTTMLTAQCSVLPVVTGARAVRGIVTWRSVAENLTLNAGATTVQQCMISPAPVLEMEQSLFGALPLLIEADGAVVLGLDKTIVGVVTLRDVIAHLGELARPFLLLGELEGFLRDLCRGRLAVEDWKHVRGLDAPEVPIAAPDVSGLTFGDYVQLLGDDAVWQRVNLRLDRRRFCASLDSMRELRNEVMHFSPDPVDVEEVESLRVFVDVCRKLRDARSR